MVLVALFLAGGGHGWYEPAIVLFPFGLISILLFKIITTPFIILAILQYPLYGFFIDLTEDFKKQKKVIISIVLLHIVLAVLILIFRGSNWQ
ncbi:hypothetical protein TH63_01290 [Rufibacter radiotolerans]|uniref:Uncharacterized protein n=1 Tax=Rufibacter radiotolerans TaxID=1379910 RepID=A0A0H4W2C4_9BACT|nr:hypothetical protein TH63_01290 [Rufibacter radiotolerans]